MSEEKIKIKSIITLYDTIRVNSNEIDNSWIQMSTRAQGIDLLYIRVRTK